MAGAVAALLMGGGALAMGAVTKNHPRTGHQFVQSTPGGGRLPACPSFTATGCDRSGIQSTTQPGLCRGTGPGYLTASPVAIGDIAFIQPMGLEIGGHVTPIDHGYFYIKGATANPPQTAAVYAPLDGIVTSVTRTVRNGGSGPTHPATYDDYAITISATCTFRVRFSNMLGYSGGLAKVVGNLPANQSESPNYAVRAGELIGYTGLPTAYGIDVWVENDDSTLTGFISPAQYTAAEAWKTHVVDLFDYSEEPVKDQMLALLERDASPRWGKIDYDIDGMLIGSWFKVGTGGYAGPQHMGEGYWEGHLSVVPDGNDPSQVDISFGDYQGQPQQFAVIGDRPDPATVSPATGLVKYELGQIERYSGTTGQLWNGLTYLPHLRTRAGSQVEATVLMQLVGTRSLKMEIFPGKAAAQVAGFDDNAVFYER